MRLSKEVNAEVRPFDFWLAIALAVVLLTGIGLWQNGTGPLHTLGRTLGPWLWRGMLVWVLTAALFQAIKYGRRAFPWPRVVFLAAFTLFAGGNALPHAAGIASWLANAGLVVISLCSLSSFLEFGKRDASPPMETPPDEHVWPPPPRQA